MPDVQVGVNDWLQIKCSAVSLHISFLCLLFALGIVHRQAGLYVPHSIHSLAGLHHRLSCYLRLLELTLHINGTGQGTFPIVQ